MPEMRSELAASAESKSYFDSIMPESKSYFGQIQAFLSLVGRFLSQILHPKDEIAMYHPFPNTTFVRNFESLVVFLSPEALSEAYSAEKLPHIVRLYPDSDVAPVLFVDENGEFEVVWGMLNDDFQAIEWYRSRREPRNVLKWFVENKKGYFVECKRVTNGASSA